MNIIFPGGEGGCIEITLTTLSSVSPGIVTREKSEYFLGTLDILLWYIE